MNKIIKVKNKALYPNEVISINFAKKFDAPEALSDNKPVKVEGINISACAKIIGITPAPFIFNGKY